jgi:hypothetical protein
MLSGQRRGPHALTARDWLFGSRPRRLALCFVLGNRPGKAGWTKSEIAIQCEVDVHGGITNHLDGLVAIGLLRERGGRYWPAKKTALARHVASLLNDLEDVPERRVTAIVHERAKQAAKAKPTA